MENTGLKGPGNTIAHQSVIAELLYAFMHKTKTTKKYSKYKSLPELPLSNTIPDITILKGSRRKYEPLAIFEVANGDALNKDLKKCEGLFDQYSSIKEAFVIVINNDFPKIHRIRRLTNGKASKHGLDSYCETFSQDLKDIVRKAI